LLWLGVETIGRGASDADEFEARTFFSNSPDADQQAVERPPHEWWEAFY
jgi:hypothetical protein